MITGDYHHTAVAVAKDVGMVKADSQVVVIDTARQQLQHDTTLLGTSDSNTSSEAKLHATPQISFRSRRAAHEVFGAPQDESARVEVALPTGRSQANRSTAEAAKGEKLLPNTSQSEGRSLQTPESAASFDSSDPSSSTLGSRIAKQSSIVATEAAVGRRVSFKGRLPLEMSSSGRRPPDAPPPTPRPDQIKLAPLARQPSKAASDSSLLPIKRKVPFERPLRLAPPPPSRLSFEGAAPQRQLSRVSSLTRLPSEAAASLLAASLPDSSTISHDDSFLNMHSSSRHFNTVLRLSNQLMQASVSRLLSPFQLYSQSTPLHMLRVASSCGAQGLTFTTGAGRQDVDPCDALTAMAEGSMQCAVTGEAFEMLLQLKEVSLLETVMRNAVVFSRMRPHQKGQVMDLRGIYQPNEGNPRHIQVGGSLPQSHDQNNHNPTVTVR